MVMGAVNWLNWPAPTVSWIRLAVTVGLKNTLLPGAVVCAFGTTTVPPKAAAQITLSNAEILSSFRAHVLVVTGAGRLIRTAVLNMAFPPACK
jgi:hypothetical protein